MRLDLNERDRFILRVAGIVFNGDKVLLHRADFDDFWTVPGGNCEYYESSEEALRREYQEELAAKIKVERLVWIVENFFEYQGRRGHEIGLYYKVDLTEEGERYYGLSHFEGDEVHADTGEKFKLIYQWFSAKEVESLDIKPDFLKNRLFQIPSETQRVVQRDLHK